MHKFTLNGKPLLYKFYDKMYRICFKAEFLKKKRDQYADQTFEVLSYAFISYRAFLILYQVAETNSTYELILQKDYRDEFEVYKTNQELPRSINLEQLILVHHHLAFKID